MGTEHGTYAELPGMLGRSRATATGWGATATKGGVVGIAIVLLMVVSATGRDPITIKLEGTVIDTLPDSVEVYVSNPREAGEDLVKKGGKRYDKTKNGERPPGDLVRFHRVDYYFKRPENAPPHNSNNRFKVGDTIYIFNLESQEQANAFATRYSLQRRGTITVGSSTKDLYMAKPGYFVFFPIKTTIYYCPIHPNQENDQEGACAVCGMPFSKASAYR